MKASDNPFPSILVEEGTAPADPSAGAQRLFVDSSDHLVKNVDSAGDVSPHQPLLLLGTGVTTPPAGTAVGTILLNKA